jgi:4-diphosphocytidyl-2C-methyl-D-erythritol kinase
MTGSGPSVFGIFSEKEEAERACKKISSKVEGSSRVFVAENI